MAGEFNLDEDDKADIEAEATEDHTLGINIVQVENPRLQ